MFSRIVVRPNSFVKFDGGRLKTPKNPYKKGITLQNEMKVIFENSK